jgi:hypothetical protein
MARIKTLLLSVLIVFSLMPAARAEHPFRGSAQWSVILCTFTDSPTPSRTPDFFRQMFINAGTGGLNDYWGDVSNRGVNLQGSVVAGWYTEAFTTAQAQARNRGQRYQDCIDAARNATANRYTPPAGQLVAVITSPGIDLFGMDGVGAFLPVDVDLGGMTHEIGHGLGFNHSFSDDPNYRNASWSQIGEYDDQWDVMSYANVFGTNTGKFGFGGPALNGVHRDRMGWIPREQIVTFGADSVSYGTVRLTPLYSPGAGNKLIRIPFDPGDLFRYYTVEYRTKSNWDSNIPADIVMIHETRQHSDGLYYSYLLRDHTGARSPVQSVSANGVTINVSSVNPVTHEAFITISTAMTGRCLQGYVWREANSADHVCVTPAVRTSTAQDNALASSRRNPGGGPYGPDTCLQGYVWREAFGGDHVCVVPAVRTRTAQENSAAPSLINPARMAYGPNTCKSGYVWREADSMDYVCVVGSVRDETRLENLLAASRRNPAGGPYGPDTCLQGYVWREAFPRDHVCVAGASRSRAADDNEHAHDRLMKP